MNIQKAALFLLMSALTTNLSAQQMWGGLKTNVLYDATTTFNIGVEGKLGRRHTMELSANLNPWTFSNDRKFKHWLLQPEWRYWLRQSLEGSFFGIHLHTGQYNVSLSERNRYQGWLVGAGIGYGHSWLLGGRWRLEAEVGVGYAYLDYDHFDGGCCGVKRGADHRHYFGPTKVALSLVCLLGRRARKAEPPVEVPVEEQFEPLAPVVVAPPPAVSQVVEKEPSTPIATPPSRRGNSQLSTVDCHLTFDAAWSTIREELGNNRAELQAVRSLIDSIRHEPGARIRSIDIAGYASPEGMTQHNQQLSEARARCMADYLVEHCQQPRSVFTTHFGGEAWDDLLEVLESDDVDVPRRQEVIDIITDVTDVELRKQRLKRLGGGVPYRYLLRNVFPQLRRVEVRISYEVNQQ